MLRKVGRSRASRRFAVAVWPGLAVLFAGCGIRIQTYSIDDEPFEQGDHEIIVAEEGSLVPPPGEFPHDATAGREDAEDGTPSEADDDDDTGDDASGAAEDDTGGAAGDDDTADGDAVDGDVPATTVDQTQPDKNAGVEFI